MKKIFSMMTVVAALMLFTSCDKHQDFPDTAMKVGYVLCTDGNVLPFEKYEQSGKKAITVVFHINQNENIEGNGYAVYLNDIAPEAFADSIGVEQGTSADLSAHDGNENTFALYDSDEVKSPLAERVFDLWRYGQSAYIPSVAQMRLLYHARSVVNPFIVKCGGTHLFQRKRKTAGTGLLLRSKVKRQPSRGCFPLTVEPYRKHPSGNNIRLDLSSLLTSKVVSTTNSKNVSPYLYQKFNNQKRKV